ncbi:hypothetical protein F4781DRAFT_429396 [Annulohypoxylon bovei var. microspora]|nr:hypothetical protein F4781DRAFT_429396 [Annulohypoxylon bovei var. microspora]
MISDSGFASLSDPDWAGADQLSPNLPSYNRRIARKRSFIFLAFLLVVAFLSLFHGDNGALLLRPLRPAPGGEAAWPQAQPLVSPDGACANAAAASQDSLSKGSLEPEYCTTWPVDSEGKYAPQSQPESKGEQKLWLDTFAPAGGWQKPRGLKVVAVVFYGRKRNVDILDCYLQQNLASNGGYLDDVWFMVHTQDAEDVAWLKDFVEKDPLYKFVGLGSCAAEKTYGCIWDHVTEKDTLYIKIDDDILYIHHDTIPQLVHTRLAQPHPYAISAQLVNSPVTGLQQYHYGAIHPFLPDPQPHPTRNASALWRPSQFGPYPTSAPALCGSPLDVAPPYRGHPWLLVSDDNSGSTAALTRTPLGQWSTHPGGEPVAFGPGWTSWAAAAQQLYSLLYNLERNQMHVYHFGRALTYATRDPADDGSHSYYSTDGHYHRHAHQRYASPCGDRSDSRVEDAHAYSGPGGEQLYDTQYERYNLNFVAVWGRDVALALPIVGDDEAEMTAEVPLRLGRPFVVDTRAVVGHLSFYTQQAGVGQTDLMDRWRAFANENVCLADNQKGPWDARCEGF